MVQFLVITPDQITAMISDNYSKITDLIQSLRNEMKQCSQSPNNGTDAPIATANAQPPNQYWIGWFRFISLG